MFLQKPSDFPLVLKQLVLIHLGLKRENELLLAKQVQVDRRYFPVQLLQLIDARIVGQLAKGFLLQQIQFFLAFHVVVRVDHGVGLQQFLRFGLRRNEQGLQLGQVCDVLVHLLVDFLVVGGRRPLGLLGLQQGRFPLVWGLACSLRDDWFLLKQLGARVFGGKGLQRWRNGVCSSLSLCEGEEVEAVGQLRGSRQRVHDVVDLG